MSTRSVIMIEGEDAMLYKHCDGYPEGVLPTLMPFLKNFFKNRGWDGTYMLARMCQHFTNEYDGLNRELAQSLDSWKNHANTYSYTGFGIYTQIPGDVEYIYVCKGNGTVQVRHSASGFWDTPDLDHTSLIDVVSVETWEPEPEQA